MKFILCLPLLKYKLHNPKAGIFFFFSISFSAINPRTRKMPGMSNKCLLSKSFRRQRMNKLGLRVPI